MLAIITGGSSGIGLAVAKYLSNRGWDLILIARDSEKLEAARALLADKNLRVAVIAHDLSRGGIHSLIPQLEEALESIGARSADLIVHSAAEIGERCYFNNCCAADKAQEIADYFVRTDGVFVLVSSIAALVDLPGIPESYSNSKRDSVLSLKRWNAICRSDMSVHVAYPPVVDTPMLDRVDLTKPVYRVFPWISADTAAEVIVRGMMAGDAEIHFKPSYALIAKVAAIFPHLVELGLLAYMSLVAPFKPSV